jgi:hypothetical protein
MAIIASTARNPHEFYRRRVRTFFELHFESFIGDRALSAPDDKALRALLREVAARDALYLRGTAAVG